MVAIKTKNNFKETNFVLAQDYKLLQLLIVYI